MEIVEFLFMNKPARVKAKKLKAITFSGGYHFKSFSGQPEPEYDEFKLPTKVVIPVTGNDNNTMTPCVKVGDEVKAGQIIARSDKPLLHPFHASINGTVSQIEEGKFSGGKSFLVHIDGNGTDSIQLLDTSRSHANLTTDELQNRLYLSGATCLGREGIPTIYNTSTLSPADVEHLIIHAISDEPYNINHSLLLKDGNITGIAEGITILKKIMPAAKCHITISAQQSDLTEEIRRRVASIDGIEVVSASAKYPQSFDEILTTELLSAKSAYSRNASAFKAVLLDIQAILAVWNAVAMGIPLIERTIALSGPRFKTPCHVKARVGTPIIQIVADRLHEGPTRLVLNSLLTGYELKDASMPMPRNASQIIALHEDAERAFLAFVRPGLAADSFSSAFVSSIPGMSKVPTTNMHGDERPCIQCGNCTKVCPARIIPTFINRQLKQELDERLVNYGIFDCIDCNICSYGCPAKIPLGTNLKKAKFEILKAGWKLPEPIVAKYAGINLASTQEQKVEK